MGLGISLLLTVVLVAVVTCLMCKRLRRHRGTQEVDEDSSNLTYETQEQTVQSA